MFVKYFNMKETISYLYFSLPLNFQRCCAMFLPATLINTITCSLVI
jgi:hypothetical protein